MPPQFFTFHFSLVIILTVHISLITSFAQNLDSLHSVWKDPTQTDSVRVIAYRDYIENGFLFTQPDSAEILAEALHSYAIKRNYLKAAGSGYSLQGSANHVQGNYSRALEYYEKSLAISEELGDKLGIGSSLNNIGNIYFDQGDLLRALEYHEKSLSIHKELSDKLGIASSMNNIGNIYNNQGNYALALENYEKSIAIYEELGNKLGIAITLSNISNIYFNQGNHLLSLEYDERSLAIHKELGNKHGIANSLNNIGTNYIDQGNYLRALEYLEKSLPIHNELGDKHGIALSLSNIGNIYNNQGNTTRALEYYENSIAIYEELEDKFGIAKSLYNIGFIYDNQGNIALAMEYFEKSLAIYEELRDKLGIALSLNSIGTNYQKQGNTSQALEYHEKSLAIYEEIKNNLGIASSLISIGTNYHKQGNAIFALNNCKKGLALAEESGALKQQMDAFKCLYDTYKAMGRSKEALVYLEKMNIIKDSLQAEETGKKLQQMEFAKQVLQDSISRAEEQRQITEAHTAEVRKKNQTRNLLLITAIFLVMISGGLFSRWRYVRKSRDIISKEKDRSENLLLNILPAEIAEELKEKGRADARDFDMVSILFTDFKGFTEKSAKLSAQELVAEINACFEAFDGIMTKFGIEKIKTIGDAYMAAGGLPVLTNDSVKNTVLAALEMQAFIAQRKAENEVLGKPAFEMRVGIHTGPVVAGIVGVKKFQYDIWGDTVNTASRMESNGEVGKVNISQATYELLKEEPDFEFESRGQIEAKGKGMVVMYFVSGK